MNRPLYSKRSEESLILYSPYLIPEILIPEQASLGIAKLLLHHHNGCRLAYCASFRSGSMKNKFILAIR